MTTHKAPKSVRYRGSKTHGGGAKKKRRGAGHRGGRGMAGSGKRADQKHPTVSKIKDYFGKHGFVKKNPRIITAINIGYFEEKINKIMPKEGIEEKGGIYYIDLSKLGYNKLLGDGNVTRKFVVKTEYASQNAIEKVKAAGGEVVVLHKEKPKENASKPQKKAAEEQEE